MVRGVGSTLLPMLYTKVLISYRRASCVGCSISHDNVCFAGSALACSFNIAPIRRGACRCHIPVTLVKTPIKRRQGFIIRIVTSSAATVRKRRCVLKGPIIPTSSVKKCVPIAVLHSNLTKSRGIKCSHCGLKLHLLPKGKFRPALRAPHRAHIFEFSGTIRRPR